MCPAVHQAVFHAEMVARGQGLVASGAGEAAQVIDGVSGAHDHLRGRNAKVAAGTSLHREPSGSKQESQSSWWCKEGLSPIRSARGLDCRGQRLAWERWLGATLDISFICTVTYSGSDELEQKHPYMKSQKNQELSFNVF